MTSAEDWTHYERLGVAEDASRAEILTAHKEMIRKLHPDTIGGVYKQTFTELSKDLNAARDALSDPDERAAYDRWLAAKRERDAEPAGDEPGSAPYDAPTDEENEAEGPGSGEDDTWTRNNSDERDGFRDRETSDRAGAEPEEEEWREDSGRSWPDLRPQPSLDWFAHDLDPGAHRVAAYSVWGCLSLGVPVALGPQGPGLLAFAILCLGIPVSCFFLSRVVPEGLAGEILRGAWLGPLGVLGAALGVSVVGGVLGSVPLMGALLSAALNLVFLLGALVLAAWLFAWGAVLLRGTARMLRG